MEFTSSDEHSGKHTMAGRSTVKTNSLLWIATGGLALGILVFLCVTSSHRPLHRVTDQWSSDNLEGWQAYGGVWSARNGVLSDSLGARGDKILVGSNRWTDYTVAATMRFDSDPKGLRWGDSGLLLRVTDPDIGVDSYNGYYVGVSYNDRLLFIGKATYAWNRLAWVPIPKLEKERWYRLKASAKGCFLSAQLSPEDGATEQVSFYDTDCRSKQGAAGLRTFNLQTSWRDFSISP